VTTRSKDNFGDMDTSVNDSSNLTGFTSNIKAVGKNDRSPNDKTADDSLAFLVPNLPPATVHEPPNADWSFSFK
jgi:hypothetical protein